MHARLEDWKNGWYGLELGLSEAEINTLIHRLLDLKRDQEQHFHLSSDYAGEGGIGDIVICWKSDGQPDNMSLGSVALLPGTEIDAPEPRTDE